MSDFDLLYGKLNEAQKRAVDTIEGPVMVVAGPGTGKTQVLAMRVANILNKTQMRPSNILCLTFSSSGATAMRERLRELIGADAYGVTVSTIHGFCQSIIDRHPVVFEQWSAMEQISDIRRYQELNTIIDQFIAHSSLLNQKDPYGRDGDLLSRFSQIKREGKTEGELDAAAKTYEELMAVKSKPGTKAHEKNIAAAKKFHEFVDLFKRYQQMLQDKGLYDYDDMILTVLKALEEEPWILESLQERYQYILVDEAQDTNGSQWKVIEMLTTYPALPHDPNIFVVGDDDQAIYRFQGANLTNMLSFHQRFPKAPVIALTVSYRSTQAILSTAQSLIEKNEERLVGRIPGLEKNLTAATKEKGSIPTLLRAASDVAEPWLTADIIEDRLKERIQPSEIAVLTQTNGELLPLYDVLKARDIPVILNGKADLLSQPVVAETIAILRSLLHLQSDAQLLSALSCTAFGCHPADLSRLVFLAREHKTSVHQLLVDIETTDAPFLKKDALIAARDALLDLSYHCLSRTVLETVERALRMVSGGALEDPLALGAIESFFSFVKKRSLDAPAEGMHAFMKVIEFYADPDYGQARLTYQLPHLVTDGVQLMTAHQSKGLEFHTVILSNFRDGHWDKRRKPGGISVPEDLLFGWESDQKKFEQHQDERRVAFVAMTRAKRELIFICAHELSVGDKHRSVSPSAFFAEAGTLPESEAGLKNASAASLMLFHPVRHLDDELAAYLQECLKNFALSATSLARFLRDPQEFLAADLLGQPEHFTEGAIRSLGYGSAVHWALREWGVARQKGLPFDEEALINAFNWYLTEKTILTDQQRQDLSALGSTALPSYFRQKLTDVSTVLYALERDYRAHLGEIPIKGKIDRIDQISTDSGNVIVIDYKTGAAKTERDIRGGLEPGLISRTSDGDRFRQLVFYALLLEQADPLLTPVGYALDFIGERGEEPERVELKVTEAEKDALRTLIKEVWTKILALDFTPLEPGVVSTPELDSAVQKQTKAVKKSSKKEQLPLL